MDVEVYDFNRLNRLATFGLLDELVTQKEEGGRVLLFVFDQLLVFCGHLG